MTIYRGLAFFFPNLLNKLNNYGFGEILNIKHNL